MHAFRKENKSQVMCIMPHIFPCPDISAVVKSCVYITSKGYCIQVGVTTMDLISSWGRQSVTTHLGAVVVFCITFVVARWYLSRQKLPPGPPALPLIGSLPWLRGDMRGKILQLHPGEMTSTLPCHEGIRYHFETDAVALATHDHTRVQVYPTSVMLAYSSMVSIHLDYSSPYQSGHLKN